MPLKHFNEGVRIKKIDFDQGEAIEIPAPGFIGHCSDLASKSNTAIRFDAPKLELAEFASATVVGGMDFLFFNEIAVHPDLFIPTQHTCPAENLGVVSIDRTTMRLELYLTHRPKIIEAATTLIGQNTKNYAHWLTETLPKLLILDGCDEFTDLPLLIDEGLHPNIYASIDLFNKNRRDVIQIKRWEPVALDRLVAVSHPGYERYVPHDIYSREAPVYINTFSRTALHMLREAARDALDSFSQPRAKRIYLSRSEKSGNIRRVENASAIEAAMRVYDIQLVVPESLSFKEQVITCTNAEVIVAPVGASLANMIFAPPGCKIIVLAPYYEGASYYYYSNLAGVLGHELYYVLGRQINKDGHPMHRDYFIDLSELEMAITSLSDNRCLVPLCAGTDPL